MWRNKALYWVSMILVIIGGVNWGLKGLLNTDLVSALFGGLARLIFILVGAAAIFLIMYLVKTGGMQEAVNEIKSNVKFKSESKDSTPSAKDTTTPPDNEGENKPKSK